MSGLDPHHFARFVEESPIHSWISDEHGSMLFANDAARRAIEAMVGHPFVAGAPITTIYPAEIAAVYVGSDHEVLATGRVVERLEPAKRADGTLAKLLVRKFPIGERDGVRLVGGIAIDITDQLRSERQLRYAEDRIAKLVEIAREGVWWVDRDFRTIFVNPALEHMLGYTAEELLGRPTLDLVAPEAQQKGAVLREQRKRGIFANVEMPFVRKDGSICWVSASSHPLIDEHGTFTGAFGLLTDITEAKKAAEQKAAMEVQLRETQKLESIGVLAGGIAHDFNNLLAAILGNLDLVARDLPASSAQAQENLRVAKEAASRAAALTRQLLAYAGKHPLTARILDIGDVVRSTVDLLGKRRDRVDVVAEGPALVRADEVQLGQVVMNLVLNAVESLRDDASRVRVTIGTRGANRALLDRAVLGSDLPEGRYAVLEVADRGSGMDPETARRIFEPFFTTKTEGRGLGLSATLGIVRSHAGALHLETAPGVGTTFTLLLPTVPPPLLLLVDDDNAVRHAAARLLEASGYTVLSASSGREAIALYRSKGSEIAEVILDLRMPGMDGEATFRELVAMDPSVRVVVCSGFLEPEVAARLLDSGVAAFVTKPFDPNAFLGVVKSALRRR